MGPSNRYPGIDKTIVSIIRRKAKQLVGKAGFVEADKTDLQQELMLDWWSRQRRYDPTRSKPSTFAARVSANRSATLIEEQTAGVRDYRKRAGSFDEDVDIDDEAEQHGGVTECHGREMATNERETSTQRALVFDVTRAVEQLAPELFSLAEKLARLNPSEAAEDGELSRTKIYRGIAKIRPQFERAGLRVYLEPDRNPPAPVGTRGARRSRSRR